MLLEGNFKSALKLKKVAPYFVLYVMCTSYIIASNQKTTPKKKTQNTSYLITFIHHPLYSSPIRDQTIQTLRDDYSNVPKPQTFLAGLRGGQTKTTVMTKMDLTLDVDQT